MSINEQMNLLHRVGRASLVIPLVLLFFVVSGCGGNSVRPTGKVLLGQQPVAGAELLFKSIDTPAVMFQGISLDDGTYVVDYGEQSGLPMGKYHITATLFLDRTGQPIPGGEEGNVLKSSGRAVAQAYSLEQLIEGDSVPLDIELDTAIKEKPRLSS